MRPTWPKIVVGFIIAGCLLIGLGFTLRSAAVTKERKVSAHVENVAYENALVACETRGNEIRRLVFTLAKGQSYDRPALVTAHARKVMHEMTSAPHALPDGTLECSQVVEKP